MVKEPPLYSAEPVSCPKDAVRLVQEMLQNYDREALVIVNLDNRGKPINLNIVSVGTLDSAIAHPREIMKAAILSNAASVLMIHNHPSGNVEPSAEDIRTTNNMYSICKLMDIPLRDHIIISGRERYFSFEEQGLFVFRDKAVEEAMKASEVRESPAAARTEWAENRQKAIREITDKLEQGVHDLFDSEQYQNYLKTMAKFHGYSLNNTLLIAMQKPDATLVAGYTAWQQKHGRQVLKGEKGIKILAPAPYKVKEEHNRMDPNTHLPVMDACGKPVVDLIEVERPAFKVATVFDVSQTEGKDLPSLGVNELTGTVAEYDCFLEALKRSCPASISFEEIDSGAKGFYNPSEDRVVVQSGMSEVQTAKTLIHEMTHQILHSKEALKDLEEVKTARTKEVEAESVAYTICQHYGIDTSDYSFGYIAGWSAGKETEELRNSLETIRKTADELIIKIDEQFEAVKKELLQDKIKETAKKLSVLSKKRGDPAR